MRSIVLVAMLFAAAASASEMRYPAAGAPAVIVKVPDGWTAKEAEGKFLAASADGTTTLTIAIVPYTGTLDALATETLAASGIAVAPTLDDRHGVSFFDLNREGYWWPLEGAGPGGKMVAFADLMLADGKALTGLMISPDRDGPGFHAGLHMLDGLKPAP
ncbi:MAG TPA: hypothetical protein VG889_11955 [Rhizomicrobium sp.]|nr:hypothetical protein [Rhizomicrobium sp.]